MKRIKIFIYLTLMVALLWPVTAFARDLHDDKVVFGGTYTLESGETHLGSLVILGGAVTTESGSTVSGDVVLIGGSVQIGGTVNGNVVGIGGAVRLGSEADINGDVFTMGATLRREEGASINGQIVDADNVPFTLNIPGDMDGPKIEIPSPPSIPDVPIAQVRSNPLLEIFWFFFRTFLYAALAILVVMFLARYVERVANAALSEPVITIGAGLLTAVLAPLALVVITITIILIPVTLVSVILLFSAWLVGWVALGLEVGRRIGKALNMDLAPAISAGVGTFILLFVLGGFREVLPCIGWLPYTLVGLWGLGAVLLTRFGTQNYPVYGGGDAAGASVLPKAEPPQVLPEAAPAGDSAEDTPDVEGDLPPDGLTP